MEEKKLSMVGWILVLLLLYLVTKSQAGYKAIYYSLILILVLLLVGQYKKIGEVMYK